MKSGNIVIVLLILLFSQCFSFIGWNVTLGGQITKIVLFILLAFCIIKAKKIPYTGMRPFVLCFMIIPFMSILGAYFIHSQSLSESFRVTMFSLSYLFFFILYIFKIDYQVLLKMCIAFGVFWVAMEVIQQFTYPTIWFGTRHDTFDKAIEIRNGIYRYNIEGREFCLILLFYSFQKYCEKNQTKYLYGIVLGLVGIYLLATRQIMVASVMCLLYGLYTVNRLKSKTLLVISVMFFLVYSNVDVLFGDFIEMTKNEDEDNIRLVSYNYWGLLYNDGKILPFLLGNGIAGDSVYGKEIAKLQSMGLFQADIGIIGMYSWYGVFYVITVLAFFLYIFKKRKIVDAYLKMYVLYMFATSVMLHHFGYSTHHIMTLCIILYLTDCSMQRNRHTDNPKIIS